MSKHTKKWRSSWLCFMAHNQLNKLIKIKITTQNGRVVEQFICGIRFGL